MASHDDTIDVRINTSLGLGYNHYDQQKDEDRRQKKQPCLKHEHSLFPGRLSPNLLLRRERKEQMIERSSVVSVSMSMSLSLSSRVLYISGHGDEEAGSPRKKLRLTKQQSATLEDTFKQQATLNPKQKQLLAAQLNLRPRQVEVWFQNRRARTKLKQTEEECEVLKKRCETLGEENKRLHKELQGLKLATSFCKHLQPAPTLTTYPSCENNITDSGSTTLTTETC